MRHQFLLSTVRGSAKHALTSQLRCQGSAVDSADGRLATLSRYCNLPLLLTCDAGVLRTGISNSTAHRDKVEMDRARLFPLQVP
eukprot:5077121-Amphidinium_carterae.1